MFAGGPRRRLRAKTTVADVGVAIASVAVAMSGNHDVWQPAFLDEQDLTEEEKQKRKAVYLVTLPHPRNGVSNTSGLASPGEFDRKAVVQLFLDVFANPVHVDAASSSRQGTKLRLEKMVVFRELHAVDESGVRHPHYHVALQASESFRFAPYKRALRVRYKLASHWSCTHEGYWSAVRYGYFPSPPKKSQADLDEAYEPWMREGQHPALFDAAQEPNTAPALKRRRETAVLSASAQGNAEPKASEIDLYPIIVRHNIRNTPDDPWAAKRLIALLKAQASPALFNMAFRIRQKLPSLIDDVWTWETVEEDLAVLGQSRLDRLAAVASSPCICRGQWQQCANYVFQANNIPAAEFCHDLYRALGYGRHESIPVMTLVGKTGGEGKSFLLAPLRTVFGREFVQESPQRGSFALLGLETKRVAILDEWEFNRTEPIPLSVQLLWFEGKPFLISRPQTSYIGHLLYQGSAPVFITTKAVHMHPYVEAAEAALAAGSMCEETMLLRRLKLYHFCEKLPLPEGVVVPTCGACFAQMVLQYASAYSSTYSFGGSAGT